MALGWLSHEAEIQVVSFDFPSRSTFLDENTLRSFCICIKNGFMVNFSDKNIVSYRLVVCF